MELNNENTWTQGEEHHTPGPVGEWGYRGGIALEKIPNVDDRLMGAAKHFFKSCKSQELIMCKIFSKSILYN